MRTFFTGLVVLAALASLLATPASAHAQTVPVANVDVVAVRARLATAVDAAMPAVRCPASSPSTIVSIGDVTRVVACGLTDGFEISVISGLGSVLAELNAPRPRPATLETATLFAEYLESLVASRRAPVELTFDPVTVVTAR